MRAILEAAARIFAARGYAGATTNHVAALAGVSIGSLYEYFPNKDALLVALLEAHLAEGGALLARTAAETLAAPGGDLRAVVRRFVEAMVALHARQPALHRVLFEEAPLPLRVRQQLARIEARLTAQVADWLRGHPRMRRRDPALAAAVVVQTVEALTHTLVVRGQGAVDVDAYVDEVVTLIAGYLTASPDAGAARPRRQRRQRRIAASTSGRTARAASDGSTAGTARSAVTYSAGNPCSSAPAISSAM